MKNLIYLIVMTMALTGCRSNDYAVKKVTEFGKALNVWSKNKFDGKYALDADKYTVEETPVNCELMTNLAKKYPIEDNEGIINTFNIEDYKTKLGQWFEDDESVLLELSDIKEPKKAELEMVPRYEELKNQIMVLEGNLTVKNYQKDTIKHKDPYKELYYIRRRTSKIVKISPRTYTDIGLIRLDFSDIEGRETIGASVNYSPNWPISLSASYSTGYFMIGIDGGLNTDKDQIIQEKLTMLNILDYTKETVTYDPIGYVTLTPSVYLKYFSIGCGLGCMFSEKNILNRYIPSTYINGIPVIKSGEPMKETHCSFMLRPNIKGYIPLNDEWFLTVNASYDWAMDIKLKNGMSFGLGMQYRLY